MGGHSTAEALSANKRSTTMSTGVPIALTSSHTPSNASMQIKHFTLFTIFYSFRDIYYFFSLGPIRIQIYFNECNYSRRLRKPVTYIKWFEYELSQCDILKDRVVLVSASQFTGNQLYFYFQIF